MRGQLNTTLLLADDDPDDRLLVMMLEEGHVVASGPWSRTVKEPTDYLHRRGRYAEPNSSPRP